MIQRVAIVGCGISGLSLATSLKRLKSKVCEVVIFDSHDDLQKFRSDHVQISGALYVLDKLGIKKELEDISQHTKRIIYTLEGETIVDIGLRNEGLDSTTFTTNRRSLRKLLIKSTFSAVHRFEETKQLTETDYDSKIIFKKNKRLLSIEEDHITGKVSLIFDDNSREENFDLVVGADGSLSTVRQFTEFQSDTVLSSIPLLKKSSLARGLQDYGLGVSLCVTPALSKISSKTFCNCKGALKCKCCGTLPHECNCLHQSLLSYTVENYGDCRHWVGDGADIYTFLIGNYDDPKLSLHVFHQKDRSMPSHDSAKVDETSAGNYGEFVRKLILDAGMDEMKETSLFSIVEAAREENGYVTDIALKEMFAPLRSWSSASGRILLVGDSAHPM